MNLNPCSQNAEATTERCPQCGKTLRIDMKSRGRRSNMQRHLAKCEFCTTCRTYRVKNSGHSKICTPERVAAMITYGQKRGWRSCPICEIPFKNCIEHLEGQHHLLPAEVDKYRLIAYRGRTKKQKKKNKKLLLMARKQVTNVFVLTRP